MPTEHKKKVRNSVKNVVLMILSTMILATADALFLSPFGIVPGGIFGISVAIDSLFPNFDCQDIVAATLQVALFIVGWIFLGKKFSLRTLLASVLFPIFFAILYRLRIDGQTLSQIIVGIPDKTDPTYLTKMILSGVAGGTLAGAGVGISFLAHGSTGGVDILTVIISKYTELKTDTISLMIDTCIVISGACIMWPMGNTDIWRIIVGIGTAFICSSMISTVFVSRKTNLMADIITTKHDEVLEFIHINMDRGSTIFDVTGGYSGTDKKIIRVAFSKRQLAMFKEFIAEVDPNAFVTIVPCTSINGEGFAAHQRRRKKENKRK